MADFHDEPAARFEVVEGLGDEAADQVEPIIAAEECECRVVHDLAGKGGALVFGDVGEIGDDAVKRAADRCKQVALNQGNSRQPQGTGIFPGEGEGIG